MEEPVQPHEEDPGEDASPDIKDTANRVKESVKEFACQSARLAKEKCREAGQSEKLKTVSATRCWGLFDLTFQGTAAARIIRIAYVLNLIVTALVALRTVRAGIRHGGGLVLIGILMFFALAFALRALVSVALAVLKNAENTARMVALLEQEREPAEADS